MAKESSYWCHVCYRTVPASEASTHQHDKDAPGKRGCSGGRSNGNSFGESIGNGPGSPHDWRMRELNEAQVTFWKLI